MENVEKPIPKKYEMQIKQLAYAREAMSNAYAVIDWLVSATQPPNHLHESSRQLYLACLAGFVVNYARPFKRAEGLDKINHGRIFSRNDQTPYEKILDESHRQILLVRDKIFAHRDSTLRLTDDRSGGIITSGDIAIELDGDGHSWHAEYLSVRPEYLPDWRRLVEVQLKRIEAGEQEVAKNLFKEHGPGRYTFRART